MEETGVDVGYKLNDSFTILAQLQYDPVFSSPSSYSVFTLAGGVRWATPVAPLQLLGAIGFNNVSANGASGTETLYHANATSP